MSDDALFRTRRRRPVTAIDQTILANDPQRPGNCFAACVATYFDLPLGKVPHFIEWGIAYGDSADPHTASVGNHWWAMFIGFVSGRGLFPFDLDTVDDAEPGEVVFVAGPSPRGVTHQVLYRDGVLIHDPHPSRAGLLTITEVMALRPLTHFDHEPTGTSDDHA